VLVSAAMPAVTLTRGDLAVALAGAGGRTVGDAAAGRMRSTLIAVQLALAMTLLAGAALLVRSFVAVRAAGPGYAAHAVLELPTSRPPLDRETDTFATEALARLGALPGVAAAAAVTIAELPGRVVPTTDPERAVGVYVEAVSPSYFAALELGIVRGRGFDDGASTRAVAVISERAARLLFDEPEAALGSSISFAGDTLQRALPVVGIAANRRARLGNTMAVADVPHAYVPLELGDARRLRLLVRSATGYPQTLGHAATETLRELDRDVVVHAPRTRADSERASSSDLRWFATVLGAFGSIAVALAALGIWSVIAYTVSRRTREIGVRMTLGATRSRIAGEMTRRIVAPIGIGLGVGVLGALGIGHLLRGLLFGVRPADPVALSGTLLVFALVALLAAWLPASRAAAVDPQRALRVD
jgi:putative ABC transport system permease protein